MALPLIDSLPAPFLAHHVGQATDPRPGSNQSIPCFPRDVAKKRMIGVQADIFPAGYILDVLKYSDYHQIPDRVITLGKQLLNNRKRPRDGVIITSLAAAYEMMCNDSHLVIVQSLRTSTKPCQVVIPVWP